MASASVDPLLKWWYTAAAEQVGIIIVCSDARRAMNKLYAARRAFVPPDPSIEALAICLSPTSADELWIVHKTVKLSEAPDAPEEH